MSARARYRPWFRRNDHEVAVEFFNEMAGAQLNLARSVEIMGRPFWRPAFYAPPFKVTLTYEDK
jgi:hypothetical protein